VTWFRPRAAVTGIGSLPIGDADRAVAFVAAHAPEVPFWPQLPLRSAAEGMAVQALGLPAGLIAGSAAGRIRVSDGDALLTHLTTTDPALRPDEAAGFAAFVRALRRGAFPAARAVKGQIAGPLTVGWALSIDGRPAWEDPVVFTAIVARIAARAAWQARALATAGLPVLLLVDEPVLGLVDVTDADPLVPVCDAIAAEGGIPGLHSCATDGELSAALPPVISLDLHGRRGLPGTVSSAWAGPPGPGTTRAAASEVQPAMVLAAGLVPTTSDLVSVPAPEQIAAAWLRLAAAVGDPGDLAQRTLLTATCGLAGVGEDAAASFAAAAGASALIQRRHDLHTPRPPRKELP
jgi:hypothetical protein